MPPACSNIFTRFYSNPMWAELFFERGSSVRKRFVARVFLPAKIVILNSAALV